MEPAQKITAGVYNISVIAVKNVLQENIFTEESAGEYSTAANIKVVNANNAKKDLS